MTTTLTHNSQTCDLNADQPCDFCVAAIEFETRQVIARVHALMAEDCDCVEHRHRTETSAFDDDWELAPRSMTNYIESTIAEYWYEMGHKQGLQAGLMQANSDLRQLLRSRASSIAGKGE